MSASETSIASPTPGPWQFYADTPSTDPNWHIVTNESRMRVIANVHIEPGNQMDLANAYLIAAAPDLLSACVRCLSLLEVEKEAREQACDDEYVSPVARAVDAARGAISKAKGEA